MRYECEMPFTELIILRYECEMPFTELKLYVVLNTIARQFMGSRIIKYKKLGAYITLEILIM